MEVSEIERLREFVDFLDGTGSIDGLSFGDTRPTTPFIAGRFWWRKTHLPVMKNAVEALTTQAAEIDALRGEVERLEKENDEFCEHLNAADNANRANEKLVKRLEATITQLRDRVAGLEEGLRSAQDNICAAYCHFDDDTMEATRHHPICAKYSALLSQNEVR